MTIGTDPLRALAAPLERLLASGGDTRLALDPATQLNGYGCRPFPRPEAFTFASSTATSISGRAYAAAAAARQELLRGSVALGLDLAFDRQVDQSRDALKRLLGLEGTGCEVVFSPSGTDAQLHALFLVRALLGAPLVSVIAAADETGSGAAFAATGRHFSALTAPGVAVVKGEPIAGLADGVESLAIPLRNYLGVPRPADELDGEVAHAIARSIAAEKRVLLFAMDRSKFGLRAPSLDCLRWIAAAAGPNVQVVIDAAQMRLGRERLHWYLEQNFIVLVTGSKFFTGAPFSGALLLPPAFVAACQAIDDVPAGMRDYTSRSDWPLSLPRLRASLSPRPNLGQWLRWVAALEEMRAYFAVPPGFRNFAFKQFADVVPRLLALEKCVEPLLFAAETGDDVDDEEMCVRTIFPFFVRRSARFLSQAEAMRLYRALNDDLSPLLPSPVPAMQRLLAARRCHIGQPVAVPDGKGGVIGALRISAGARVVSENWDDDILIARENLRGEYDQIRAILEKIRLIVRHFDDIAPAYAEPHAGAPYRVNAA